MGAKVLTTFASDTSNSKIPTVGGHQSFDIPHQSDLLHIFLAHARQTVGIFEFDVSLANVVPSNSMALQ